MTTLLLKRGGFSALTLEGFIEREATLWNALNKSTEESLAKLKSELLRAALSDGLLTLFGRHKLNRAVNAALKKFTDSLLEIAPAVAADAQESIAREAVAESQNRWFGKPKVGKADAQEILEREFLLRNNALFMGKFLNETLPEKVKYAITEAYNAALGKPYDEKLEIVQNQLAERFGKVAEAPSNYWKVFSVNALNNARTYAQLRTFEQQPGVVGYRIRSVIDGKTSNICRALSGKVFPIKQALARFDQMFQAQSLDDLRTLSPMVQGTIDKGFHYDLGRGAGKQTLDIQNYQGLLDSGISFPPFHFNCRSSVQPVFGTLPEGVSIDDLDDFENQVLVYEFEYHTHILKDLDIELGQAGQIQDLKKRKDELTRLSQTFYKQAKEFDYALNFGVLKKEFEDALKKASAGDAQSVRDLRGRVLELQGAHFAQAKKHQIIGVNIKVATLIEKMGSNKLVETDFDLLTFDGSALCNWQFKFGKPLGKEALANLKSQLPDHLIYMVDPSLFEMDDRKRGFKPTAGNEFLYVAITRMFGQELPEKRIIFGATNAAATGKKKLFDDIIEERVKKNKNVSIIIIRNINSLDSEIQVFGGQE